MCTSTKLLNLSVYFHSSEFRFSPCFLFSMQPRLLARRINEEQKPALRQTPKTKRELTQTRLPLLWSTVSLTLIDIIGNSQQLWVDKVISKSLTLSRGPCRGTCFPGVTQRNKMININIGGGGPGCTIVWRYPGSRCGSTGRINDDIFTVAL